MKARVLTPFVDKHTGAFYRVGEILDVSGDRFEEIAAAGDFVEALEAPAPAAKTAKKKTTKRKG